MEIKKRLNWCFRLLALFFFETPLMIKAFILIKPKNIDDLFCLFTLIRPVLSHLMLKRVSIKSFSRFINILMM